MNGPLLVINYFIIGLLLNTDTIMVMVMIMVLVPVVTNKNKINQIKSNQIKKYQTKGNLNLTKLLKSPLVYHINSQWLIL